eukprot:IDg5853t1
MLVRDAYSSFRQYNEMEELIGAVFEVWMR